MDRYTLGIDDGTMLGDEDGSDDGMTEGSLEMVPKTA